MNTHRFAYLAGFVAVLAASPSFAQDDASASASLSLSDGLNTSSSAQGDGDYMTRYRPEAGLLELGIFVGALFPSKDHNILLEDKAHQEYGSLVPEVGLRVGYYPLSFLGAELEGAVGKGSVDDESATMLAGRGHVVGQLPFWSVTPFVLGGFGRLAMHSDPLGNDGDPAYHFGAGVKVPVNEMLSVRLDLRDNLTQKYNAKPDTLTHHPEIQLGLTGTFGRSSKPEGPKDRDGDGFDDGKDRCPDEPGVAPDGCPVKDSDGDGVPDPQDQCPEAAGPAPTGCPVDDSDGDGFDDSKDQCPDVKGIAPDGCPDEDPDKDGVLGKADKCPNEPETKNGFQDDDGCPDEVPDAVKKFTGVIEGIQFDTGLATIRASSKPTLDQAAAVLSEHPSLRVLITGHTDTDGTRDRNMKLSADRAESVKAYLVIKGIDAGRVETRGAGPDEPIADNATAEGKQKNRRIEFKLLSK